MAALSVVTPLGEIACGSEPGKHIEEAIPRVLIWTRELKGYSDIDIIVSLVGGDKMK